MKILIAEDEPKTGVYLKQGLTVSMAINFDPLLANKIDPLAYR